MRLIDADELYLPSEEMISKMIIASAPTVEGAVIRPKGKWIEGKFTNDDIRNNDYSYKCSHCGEIFGRTYDFCVCGADMRGKNES